MDWRTIDRPGYFGDKRDELQSEWNNQFGDKNWRIAWEFGESILLRPEALQLYEDGYYEHFKVQSKLVDWLTKSFSGVYDTAPSNIESGFSYDVQETPNNHLHDVTIRRAVMRLGRKFSGDKLLEVRSTDGEGWVLSPCNIPFHLPQMIYAGQIKYKGEERDFSINPPWWIKRGVKNSVEQFYQQNKLLQIRE